jgi:ferredoxin-type protein NapH
MIVKARRTIQLLTLALLALVPVLNKKGITLVSGSLYSFAIGPVWITDPLIGIQTLLTALSLDLALLLSMTIPLILAFALGRVFCGWICPQNTLSEIADAMAAKIGIKRLFSPRRSSVPRYVVLGCLLVLIPLTGIPLASLLSAPGIISVQASQLILQGAAGLELGLIGLIVIAELFLVRRGWCNYVCPVGTFLGLFRVRKTMKVVFLPDADRVCGNCLACADACGLGLNPVQDGIYPQCHNCGACVAACGEIKGGKKPLMFKL